MSDRAIANRLRRFLLGLTAFIAAGAIVELWLQDHTGSSIQFVPFGLSAVTILSCLVVLRRPKRGALRFHRFVMTIVVLGGAFGIYEHIEHNIEFAMDIRPNATFGDVWVDALRGANPLLAPGVYVIAGVLGIAGVYKRR